MSEAIPSEPEKELDKTFNRYNQEAYLNADVALLDEILADDWMITTADGQVKDKAWHLKEVAAGILKVHGCEIFDVKYRVYADSAIATGRRQNKVTYNHQDVSAATQFSQFYVREGGKWRCVNTQVTRVR